MSIAMEKKPRLKPPMNLRRTTPRCCGLCRRGFIEGSFVRCERLPENKNIVADLDDYYTTVCDRYER